MAFLRDRMSVYVNSHVALNLSAIIYHGNGAFHRPTKAVCIEIIIFAMTYAPWAENRAAMLSDGRTPWIGMTPGWPRNSVRHM